MNSPGVMKVDSVCSRLSCPCRSKIAVFWSCTDCLRALTSLSSAAAPPRWRPSLACRSSSCRWRSRSCSAICRCWSKAAISCCSRALPCSASRWHCSRWSLACRSISRRWRSRSPSATWRCCSNSSRCWCSFSTMATWWDSCASRSESSLSLRRSSSSRVPLPSRNWQRATASLSWRSNSAFSWSARFRAAAWAPSRSWSWPHCSSLSRSCSCSSAEPRPPSRALRRSCSWRLERSEANWESSARNSAFSVVLLSISSSRVPWRTRKVLHSPPTLWSSCWSSAMARAFSSHSATRAACASACEAPSCRSPWQRCSSCCARWLPAASACSRCSASRRRPEASASALSLSAMTASLAARLSRAA
mmetsp:Transcript_40804/g.106237  ORF Transcript_40804/g.106237 Transcript_40804/m.106237 type:complete len:362 (-) Transcript_40804:379-1464(-)